MTRYNRDPRPPEPNPWLEGFGLFVIALVVVLFSWVLLTT